MPEETNSAASDAAAAQAQAAPQAVAAVQAAAPVAQVQPVAVAAAAKPVHALHDAAASAPALPNGAVNVTYTPLDDGDPPVTLWNSVRFRANLPVPVEDPVMISLAKGNPWFRVDGFPQAERGSGVRIPKTAEEYRFYATQWFKLAPNYNAFVERWKAEQGLRDKAGVGADDEEWLDSIAGPILHELEKVQDAEA